MFEKPYSMEIEQHLKYTKKEKNPLLIPFIILCILFIICLIISILFLIVNINNISEEVKKLGNNINKLDNLVNTVSELENDVKEINIVENKLNVLSNEYYNYKNNLFDDIFPIGSYYISSDDTNPSILFGGTWEQIKERFIIGASDNYKVNSVGGEAKHKLTEDEMPSHRHNTLDWNHRGMYFWGGGGTSDGPAAGNGYRTHAIDVFTSYTGGNNAHNNIPPYKAAFIWRRIGL